jgi:hypothetical protein
LNLHSFSSRARNVSNIACGKLNVAFLQTTCRRLRKDFASNTVSILFFFTLPYEKPGKPSTLRKARQANLPDEATGAK